MKKTYLVKLCAFVDRGQGHFFVYSAGRPIIRKVWKIRIWVVPPPGLLGQ